MYIKQTTRALKTAKQYRKFAKIDATFIWGDKLMPVKANLMKMLLSVNFEKFFQHFGKNFTNGICNITFDGHN